METAEDQETRGTKCQSCKVPLNVCDLLTFQVEAFTSQNKAI